METSIDPQSANWLIPSLVDFRARSEPDTVFCLYPTAHDSYNEGFEPVSYGKLANAINGAAHWMEKTLGKAAENQVLAYLGPNDLRFPILIVAAIKVGYTMLLLSPRNSLAAQQNLFQATKCNKLLTPSPQPPSARVVIQGMKDLELFQVPSLNTMLGETFPSYPYDKTFAENKTEPFVVLHTSGSTGLPKPIHYTHEWPAAWQQALQLPTPEGMYSVFDVWMGKRLLSLFPPFHIAGVANNFTSAVFNKTTLIFPLATRPPSAQDVVDALEHVKVDAVGASPLTCLELVNAPALLDSLAKKAEYLFFSGGACPAWVGDVITRKMKFLGMLGSSEAGGYLQVRRTGTWAAGEWNYAEFNPLWSLDMRRVGGDLHEAVFVRNPDSGSSQTVFTVFPELETFPTKDIFAEHPTKPRLWMHKGRLDDIIVFLNGEKTNPIEYEATVNSHSEINAALVIGTQRFQAALLIEPKRSIENASARAKFLEHVWQIIEKANAACPAHARVERSHVLFTTPSTPMLRAGKGTIQRQLTLDLYKDDIDRLYLHGDMQLADVAQRLAAVAGYSHADLIGLIRDSVRNATKWEQLALDDDFFTLGMDSLQVLQLTRNIKSVLNCPALGPSVVYTNGTVNKLIDVIFTLDKMEQLSEQEIKTTHEKQINVLFEAHSKSVAAIERLDQPKTSGVKQHRGRVVILTGATGAIGSYVLRELLSSEVSHVYCLSRSARPAELQARRNKARGLDYSWEQERVTHLSYDPAKPSLGLGTETLARLSETVTDIIHASWPVNFNMAVTSFEPQLVEVVEWIRFASLAAAGPRIVFLSSISSVFRYSSSAASGAHVPERVFDDASVADLTGYGGSKHIAERLLAQATKLLAVPCSILRIGQVAGPSIEGVGNGTWARQEWLPSIVISSARLGVLPSSLGDSEVRRSRTDMINWIPIDLLAKVVLELAHVGKKTLSTETPSTIQEGESLPVQAAVFHVVNPQQTTWQALFPALQKAMLAHGRSAEPVLFKPWIEQIRDCRRVILENPDEAHRLIAEVPATKLLDFYESLLTKSSGKAEPPQFETKNAESVSAKLRGIGPISAGQMEAWTSRWMSLL